MNTVNGTIIWTLTILTVLGASLVCLSGCQERVEIAKTLEAAEAQDIVETARTEAATEAKIKMMNAVIETGCNVAAWVCLGIAILGVWPFKSRLMIGLGLMGVVIFTIATFWMAAKAEHPQVIAAVGLVIILSILATFIVVVIQHRKALMQVVLGNENYKDRLVSDNHIFGSEQEKVQTPTTTKIVDKIRNNK